jgi:hypothetical protein
VHTFLFNNEKLKYLKKMITKLLILTIFFVIKVLAVLNLDNESELRESQAALFNVNSNFGWLLLNYVGPSTIHFTASGEGGAEDLSPNFKNDQIQYALIRIKDYENKIRDIFITWIGSNVDIIEKGNKLNFLDDVQLYLQPFHADVTVLNKDKFTYNSLLDKSNPLSGSHVID